MAIWTRTNRYFRREDGSVTVEAVLWVPFFLIFMTFIADVALILNGQAKAQRIVQDANRSYSLGFFDDTTEVEDFIEAQLTNIAANATAETQEVDGVVRTAVSMSSIDMISVGLVSRITNVDLSFASFHSMEI